MYFRAKDFVQALMECILMRRPWCCTVTGRHYNVRYPKCRATGH